MQTPHSMHATLEAILRFPSNPMTAAEVADCLGVVSSTITRACQGDRIEHTKINCRGVGATQRYRLDKSAVIKWLWDNTSGDRAVLRAAIDTLCPDKWRVLEPKTAAAAAAAKKPKNVLAFEHPDLFNAASPQPPQQ